MKKKAFVFLLSLILCLCMAAPVLCAQAAEGFADEYYRVVDMAELLTDNELTTLIATLDEISERQHMDIVVATTNELDGYSVQDYADLLYESCNFGYGSSKDGLLLLISMQDRDWYISTCGYGITVFTDAGIEYIGDQITSELSDGNYAAAFSSYAALCDDFITQANTDKPYDRSNLPAKPLSLIWIPVSLVIGFVIAKIVVGNMKSKLKTVRSQTTANSYVKDGSMQITDSRDLFLYHTVAKTAKPKNTSSGSSGTHTSSSGTTHGGGGGKF